MEGVDYKDFGLEHGANLAL